MDRRTFAAGLALAPVAWSCARAPSKIGVMLPGSSSADLTGPDTRMPAVVALMQGLRDLGYQYGRDFVVEGRGAEGHEARYDALAAELAAANCAVILAPDPMLPALKRLATAPPVVMAAASDPVAAGFAQSLARPGGRFTGLSLQLGETSGKRLELLREVARGSGPVAVLAEPGSRPLQKAVEDAARAMGWSFVSLVVRNQEEIESAFREASGAGAALVLPGGLVDRHQREVVELAARYRLPAMYGFRRFVESGGLMSYSADIVAIWRRAAYFVDRILKGTPPGELPIEQPTRFDLVVNLWSASAAGIEIPTSLRQRATEVIVSPPPR